MLCKLFRPKEVSDSFNQAAQSEELATGYSAYSQSLLWVPTLGSYSGFLLWVAELHPTLFSSFQLFGDLCELFMQPNCLFGVGFSQQLLIQVAFFIIETRDFLFQVFDFFLSFALIALLLPIIR